MPRAADAPRDVFLGGFTRLRSRAVAVLVVAALGLTACANDEEPAPESSPPAEAIEIPTPPTGGRDDVEAAEEEPDESVPEAAPSPAAAEEAPPLPENHEEVVARTSELVREAVRAGSDATLGVYVTDQYGREIAAHQPDEPLLPASTLKVVTAAALLLTVGPEATFTTRVETTAPIELGGRIRGDLALVGGGDPALATDEYGRWVYPARPRTPLAALADDLVELGVTHVEGDVVGMAPGFAGPTRAEGWPDRYFSSFDARYASGLTVDAGLRTILTYPEPEEDEEAEGGDEDPRQDEEGDEPPEEATEDATADEPSEDTAPLEDVEASEGEVGADEETPDPEELGPPDVTIDHVLDPAGHAATELVRLLEDRGVTVDGEGRSGDIEGPFVGRLATVRSPPMEDLLRFAVQRSDNQLTDGMFQAIGRIRTGEGSWTRGERALRQVLDRLEIDHSMAVFADGSGLSRDDRLTARLLVDLDRHMNAGPHAGTWLSLMAVMGESGTLRERLRGTVAAGRFHGKTGTLRDVTALSGSVIGDDGARYHLAVIANEAEGQGRWVARELMDELILQLSAESAGCTVSAPEVDPEEPRVPRSSIAC